MSFELGMSFCVSGRPRKLLQDSLGTARRDLSPLITEKNREASKLRKRKMKDGEGLEEWEARCLRDNMGKKGARKKKKKKQQQALSKGSQNACKR
jgi:hypothetical protein